MLKLVIASSAFATILLVAALVEMFCRWAVESFEQRASKGSLPQTCDSGSPLHYPSSGADGG